MRHVKVIFVLAGIALVGAVGCFLALVYVPAREDAQPESEVVLQETDETEESEQSEDLEKLAEQEVARFKEAYGMEIPMEEMRTQLELRKEYEETYGKAYELEDVFLAEEPTSEEEGDPASEEYADIIEQIQKYLDKYNVDESRYASMTAQEELAALEVEYGPLTEETEASADGSEDDVAEATEQVPEEVEASEATQEEMQRESTATE